MSELAPLWVFPSFFLPLGSSHSPPSFYSVPFYTFFFSFCFRQSFWRGCIGKSTGAQVKSQIARIKRARHRTGEFRNWQIWETSRCRYDFFQMTTNSVWLFSTWEEGTSNGNGVAFLENYIIVRGCRVHPSQYSPLSPQAIVYRRIRHQRNAKWSPTAASFRCSRGTAIIVQEFVSYSVR